MNNSVVTKNARAVIWDRDGLIYSFFGLGSFFSLFTCVCLIMFHVFKHPGCLSWVIHDPGHSVGQPTPYELHVLDGQCRKSGYGI